MALKERLNTDVSLRPILAQFVPLQLDTDKPEFQTWARQFPPKGNGIPMIFIVRADGEVLHNESGAPAGPALPQLLSEMRKKAGSAITEKQAEQLAAAAEAASKALAAGDTAAAVSAIGKNAGLVSYAEAAVALNKVVEQLTETAKATIAKADEQLSNEGQDLDGALALLEVERVFKSLPDVVKQAREVKTKHSKQKRSLFTQAGFFDKARDYEAQKQADKAVRQYKTTLDKYPNSKIAQYAQARIDELGAKGADLAATSKPAGAKPQASEVGKPPAIDPAVKPAGGASSAEGAKTALSFLKLARTFATSRPDKAKEYAQKAISAAPNSAEAREARDLLKILQ